jgi:hypothetical protein
MPELIMIEPLSLRFDANTDLLKASTQPSSISVSICSTYSGAAATCSAADATCGGADAFGLSAPEKRHGAGLMVCSRPVGFVAINSPFFADSIEHRSTDVVAG